jgi:hypothetical protein
MKAAIRGLHLKGKIVLIAEHAGKCFAGLGNDYDGSVPRVQILVRIDNRFTNFSGCMHAPIIRQIRAQKPALPVNGVAVRTTRAPKEQKPSMLGITRYSNRRFPLPLKNAEIVDYGVYLRCIERRPEFGHARRRDA